MKAEGLIRVRYSRLVVLGVDRSGRYAKCLCRCDCGTEKLVVPGALKSGSTKSCGCLKRSIDGELRAGKSYQPGYRVWLGMMRRCYEPSAAGYARYGGRGIKVCERWQDYRNFLADMPPRPSMQYTLDRIDNDGDYELSNCRWATRTEQNRNSRRNVVGTVRGVTGCVSELCEHFGLDKAKVYGRLRNGKTIEQAFS